MFQNKYPLESAMEDAAKAAYLATCIEKGVTHLNKYSGNPAELTNLTLPPTLTSRLNKLRRTSPIALYYWIQTGKLL
jgi:hypothetical protein